MKTYLVGGAVRDQLLNIPVHDHDWVVVGGTAEAMVAKGFQPVGKDFPVFLHPKSKEEYALARTERKSGHGYKGFEFYATPDVTLEEDLARRDLTINAMAMDDNGQLNDPYHGKQDLDQRLLRHVSDAFAEDPLRVLRVARFNARFHHLGFHIADETLALMQNLAAQGEIEHLTKERVWQELYRALGEKSPDVFFAVLEHAHALKTLIPEISQAFAQQGEASTLELLQLAGQFNNDGELRLALLCYKANLSAAELEQLLERINAPKRCQRCCSLISSQLGNLTRFAELNEEELLALYQHIDPRRRPENIQWIQQAMEVLSASKEFSSLSAAQLNTDIKKLIEAVESIIPANLVAEGLKGKALGETLQKRQLEAIRSQFSKGITS